MFKRFDPSDCSTSTQVKTSAQRAIKAQILESHPALNSDDIDEILPKKPPLMQYKSPGHVTIFCRDSEPIFFQHRDGPILPTLRFVHRYPHVGWTHAIVDKGAIPFILGGAHIMCVGLTSAGGSMPTDLEAGRGLVIMAEGKDSAIAVGSMKLSTHDVKNKNKGVGIDCAHFLGDDLFNTNEIS